jgi:hypothetical protein
VLEQEVVEVQMKWDQQKGSYVAQEIPYNAEDAPDVVQPVDEAEEKWEER